MWLLSVLEVCILEIRKQFLKSAKEKARYRLMKMNEVLKKW